MNANAWLTLLAIVLGPIIAVGITLIVERFRRTRDRRLQVVKMLLASRHLPADAQYNIAVNLIPADFNDQPHVMEAWRRYHEIVRERQDTPDHMQRMAAAQSTMIFHALKSAGLAMSEGDIQSQAYVSQAFLDRDNLYLDFLRAMPPLTAAMETQVTYTRAMVERLLSAPPPGGQEPTPPADSASKLP